jgi:iron(III) transport system substrate-binding protein
MLMEERSNPRCSVFWNNELANTVRLAQAGLLEPYDSPAARDVPAAYRDARHRWTGFAARARVLVVNTDLLPDQATWPRSYTDLIDPKWKGRCGVARPTTGTTMTHFTALRQVLGEDGYGRLLDGLVANDVKLLASNGATVNAVREGKLAWAFTDTDDYHVAKQKGFPVACVFPDQQEGGIGTMLIPNSVAIIKGGPDQANARRLVDKIVARETEALLAATDGAQIPLRTGIAGPDDPGIKAVGSFRAMTWDVEWTASNLARCAAEWDRRFGK